MLATRQLLGVARSRALGSAASKGVRCMATATDSPLDRKVSNCDEQSSFICAANG